MRFLPIFLAGLLVGCGGPPAYLETTVTAGEVAVDAADEVYAPLLEKAIADAESLSEDLRDEQLAPYLRAAEVLERADQAARTARIALETWGDADQRRGFGLVACLSLRLVELVNVLKALEVPIPDELLKVVAVAGKFLVGGCPDE